MSPFAELHLHLEGSLEPETIAEIDPSITIEEAESKYRYPDFAGFLQAYKWVLSNLQTPEHYAIAARALRAKLAQQNIVHAEINLSVGAMLFFDRDVDAIFPAIKQELGDWPLIFDAIRQFDPKTAIRVAELSLKWGAAFGIGGDEAARPLSEFREAIALTNGKFIPHAGETSNARNVWDAVEHGARRIGHGIRSIDDPVLCKRLRDDDIPLEISISSNVATGAVPSLEAHPVRQLFDLGVPIVLNTDDPAMFHTTLAKEFEIARQVFRFSDTEIEILRQNSFKYSMTRESRRASSSE